MNYKLRGKCKEYSEQLCRENKELTLVRGFYYCPIWNSDEQHWWTKDKNDVIIDPTKEQFPSNGAGTYREFDGIIVCSECGDEFPEGLPDAMFQGSYACCSGKCFGKLVGLRV